MKKRGIKDRNFNIPNALSALRIVLSPILILMVFLHSSILSIVIVFAIAALTDALDGYIARHFNQKTELGRKLDMFADRILMISAIIGVLSYMQINNLLTQEMITQIILIVSREIIALPFLIIALLSGGVVFPNARKVAKLMTLMQGVTFPMIILGWSIAWYFAVITCIIGIISGIYYAKDSWKRL